MGMPGLRKPMAFVEDTAVDPHRLTEFIARFREILAAQRNHGAYYGHASVGCLHIRPMLDTADRDDLARLEADLARSLRTGARVRRLDERRAWRRAGAQLFEREAVRAADLSRRSRDQASVRSGGNLMNPGKIVTGPSPIENLRSGPTIKPLPVATTFDFSREGARFAEAAEMCNGSGVCRKRQTGTMCPSFMVTRDEEHSTRGRANALRLALSGRPAARAELTGPRMFARIDLCLGCKGCKAECPSNVDVAKLKVEFLRTITPSTARRCGVRLMADAARLNRWGSALAPVSNWLAGLPVPAGWPRRLLGMIVAGRCRVSSTPFRSVVSRAAAARRQATRGPIVLLDDCLTSYCEPASQPFGGRVAGSGRL